ncbi:hypothetical protein E2C01_049529 [Portunus trituberculatus]|uniref:Uncharacterized protein n=1 Tax=Portunus trituberculatus TaxID=210409 RepID=A0A5B7GEM9_PORTR|nr:hypothetical protein [Portunus trituberculatus]
MAAGEGVWEATAAPTGGPTLPSGSSRLLWWTVRCRSRHIDHRHPGNTPQDTSQGTTTTNTTTTSVPITTHRHVSSRA